MCWLPNRLEWLQLIAAAAPPRGADHRPQHPLPRRRAASRAATLGRRRARRRRRVRRHPLRSDGGRRRGRIAAVGRRRRRRPRCGMGRGRLRRARRGTTSTETGPSTTSRRPRTCYRVHDVGHDRVPEARRARPGRRRAATAFDDVRAFDMRPGDRLLLDLPLCGTFGFTPLLAAIAGRATTLDQRALRSRRHGAGDRRRRRHALQRQRRHAAAHPRHRVRASRRSRPARGRVRQLHERRAWRRPTRDRRPRRVGQRASTACRRSSPC